jgi:hypothetical protein
MRELFPTVSPTKAILSCGAMKNYHDQLFISDKFNERLQD